MDYNYHAHTPFCGHATGTEREYIEAAIAAGLKEWGFSDHIPFIFPDGKENSYRVPVSRVQEHIDIINALKEEYKDKINIHIGFETEYYPEHFEKMVENARSWGAEYLILGQHSVGTEPEHFFWSVEETDNVEHLKEYVNRVVAAIESGYITYVAHPDVFNFVCDEKIYNEEMTKIIKAAEKHKVPLEINLLGIRENRHYPTEKFWRLAQGYNIDVVFGMDAHNVSGAGDTASAEKAIEICKKYNLNVLKRPKLIRL